MSTTRNKLNLKVLKRHDSNMTDILDQSVHAVVYKFDPEKKSWEKLGYEGVVFLVKRKIYPQFSLYILNRVSIENYCLHLTDFEEMTLIKEFIIYQTIEGESCALWLYEKKDRKRLLFKVKKLRNQIEKLSRIKSPERQMNLLEVLKRASSHTTPIPQKNQLPQDSPVPTKILPKENYSIASMVDGMREHLTQKVKYNHAKPIPENKQDDYATNTKQVPKDLIPSLIVRINERSPSLPEMVDCCFSDSLHQQQPSLSQQQVISFMLPEMTKRLNERHLLSKSEFIQQLIYILKNDPLFCDNIYESYKTQNSSF